MDGFQLIAELASALAWPIVALVGLIMIGPKVDGWIKSLRKVEGWGVKAEFKELEQLEVSVVAADQASEIAPDRQTAGISVAIEPPVGPNLPPAAQETADLARMSAPPTGPQRGLPLTDIKLKEDIQQAWHRTIRQMRAVYALRFPDADDATFIQMVSMLNTNGVMSDALANAFFYAREAYNAIRDGKRAINSEEAARFQLALSNLSTQLARR